MNIDVSKYRNLKILFILLIDIISCILSVWLAFSLRLEIFYYPTENFYFHSFISVILFLAIFYIRKNYSIIFRTQGINDLKNIFISWFIFSILVFIVLKLTNFKPDLNYFDKASSSIIIIQCFLFVFFLLIFRALIIYIIFFINKSKSLQNVVIYGAGVAGRQLSVSLASGLNYNLEFFIDDNETLQNNFVNSVKIISFEEFEKIYIKNKIRKVFISIPSLSNEQRNEIFKKLENLDLEIKILPSLEELANSKINYSKLKKIEINDILNRDIKFNFEKASKYFSGKNVLVTGAGGSIGKEICKQFINLNLNKLIMIDNCEYNLFNAERGLQIEKENSLIQIVPLLLDITDKFMLDKVFKNHKIDLVFHAAAYKHVDMLQKNPITAYINNFLATTYLVKLSDEYLVEKMTLISTDKAVNPTNHMGLSKRFCELFLKTYSGGINNKTIFSTVRFGNVLGSSGSVIPIFQEQINNGGPVTVTDKNVERYFMTIPEAVKLIIESSINSTNNEIYFLNMGKPHNIYNLAKKLISLSGLKFKKGKIGDIEIIITGLKKGEKMFEDLSYSKPKNSNINKDIFIDDYEVKNSEELQSKLNELIKFIESNDEKKILDYSSKINIS